MSANRFFSDRKKKEEIFSEYWKKLGVKKWGQLLLFLMMEFFATYAFATIVLSVAQHGYSNFEIASVEAITLLVIIILAAREYAGHLSPFVTIALYAGGKIPYPWWTCIFVLIATTGGWILGTATTIGFTIGSDPALGLGTPKLDANYTDAVGFLAECFGTCFSFGVPILLLYSFSRKTLYSDISTMDKKRDVVYYPFVVSAAHFVAHMATSYISGASLNPHRFFWPAVISGKLDNNGQWIYLVGPLIGVIICGLIFIVIVSLDYCSYRKKTTIQRKLAKVLDSDEDGDDTLLNDVKIKNKKT